MEIEPPNDMRDLWQSQKRERPNVSLQLIRLHAEKLDASVRREVFLWYAVSIMIVAGFAWGLRPHETIRRIGLGLLIAWAVYVPFLAHRRIWPRFLPADAGTTTCLEFYKGELERLRDYVRNVWKWILLPLLPGVGLLVGPLVIKAIRNPVPWINAMPFCLLLAIWAVAFVLQRRRKLRDYQREIDVLDAIQKGA